MGQQIDQMGLTQKQKQQLSKTYRKKYESLLLNLVD